MLTFHSTISLLVLTGSILVAGCAGHHAQIVTEFEPLPARLLENPSVWILQKQWNSQTRTYDELNENRPTLIVEAARISGNSVCNRYFASYSSPHSRLKISPIATTRKLCPEPLMRVEQAYLKQLKKTACMRLNQKRLELFEETENAQASLIFEKTP